MRSAGRPRFVLDQNFPTPIIEALRAYIVEAELVALSALHPRLSTLDDWQLLVALSQEMPQCDGLVTTDNSMLRQERELATLLRTKLTLVVADAVGDDPIKATGLVLAHLPWIAKQRHRHEAQVWVLRTVSKPGEDPWDRLKRIAGQQGEDARALYDRYRIPSLPQLARDLLAAGPNLTRASGRAGKRLRPRRRR